MPKVGDMFYPAPARGVTQGLGEMTADAPLIPRSKLVKSGRTLGGA